MWSHSMMFIIVLFSMPTGESTTMGYITRGNYSMESMTCDTLFVDRKACLKYQVVITFPFHKLCDSFTVQM